MPAFLVKLLCSAQKVAADGVGIIFTHHSRPNTHRPPRATYPSPHTTYPLQPINQRCTTFIKSNFIRRREGERSWHARKKRKKKKNSHRHRRRKKKNQFLLLNRPKACLVS